MRETFGREGTPCVVIVDDEEAVLLSLGDLLRKEFFLVATTDPETALRELTLREVAVIVSDQRMPRMSGARLLEESARLSPMTARILLTGYSDIGAVIEAVNQGKIFYYVAKPWRADQMLSLIREAARFSGSRLEASRLIAQLSEVTGRLAPHPHTRPESGPEDPPLPETEILRRTVDTFSEAVSVLEAIKAAVPICVYCRKVKTSQDEWHEAVEYLQTNSLVLSHGICPKCLHPVMNAQLQIPGAHG